MPKITPRIRQVSSAKIKVLRFKVNVLTSLLDIVALTGDESYLDELISTVETKVFGTTDKLVIEEEESLKEEELHD